MDVRDRLPMTEDDVVHPPPPPAWRLAGEDEDDSDPHIVRGID